MSELTKLHEGMERSTAKVQRLEKALEEAEITLVRVKTGVPILVLKPGDSPGGDHASSS